ncbi:hypothetical protein HGRIS_004401 [Hohenbuehelia grisea]|uniref:Uncharacterized protein n=1 Tax=Hohenbuehelia grisea TaxID=104357 RepID=A0ABR3JBT9_9AGAR
MEGSPYIIFAGDSIIHHPSSMSCITSLLSLLRRGSPFLDGERGGGRALAGRCMFRNRWQARKRTSAAVALSIEAIEHRLQRRVGQPSPCFLPLMSQPLLREVLIPH